MAGKKKRAKKAKPKAAKGGKGSPGKAKPKAAKAAPAGATVTGAGLTPAGLTDLYTAHVVHFTGPHMRCTYTGMAFRQWLPVRAPALHEQAHTC